MTEEIRKEQESVCRRYGAEIADCPEHLKVGISRTVFNQNLPINGVRVESEGGMTGWYIWAGDWSDAPDFFVPLHVGHLRELCPLAIPYLLLPSGWRFQIAPGHEDVWFDPEVRC